MRITIARFAAVAAAPLPIRTDRPWPRGGRRKGSAPPGRRPSRHEASARRAQSAPSAGQRFAPFVVMVPVRIPSAPRNVLIFSRLSHFGHRPQAISSQPGRAGLQPTPKIGRRQYAPRQTLEKKNRPVIKMLTNQPKGSPDGDSRRRRGIASAVFVTCMQQELEKGDFWRFSGICWFMTRRLLSMVANANGRFPAASRVEALRTGELSGRSGEIRD